jgi:hypothetical protein
LKNSTDISMWGTTAKMMKDDDHDDRLALQKRFDGFYFSYGLLLRRNQFVCAAIATLREHQRHASTNQYNSNYILFRLLALRDEETSSSSTEVSATTTTTTPLPIPNYINTIIRAQASKNTILLDRILSLDNIARFLFTINDQGVSGHVVECGFALHSPFSRQQQKTMEEATSSSVLLAKSVSLYSTSVRFVYVFRFVSSSSTTEPPLTDRNDCHIDNKSSSKSRGHERKHVSMVKQFYYYASAQHVDKILILIPSNCVWKDTLLAYKDKISTIALLHIQFHSYLFVMQTLVQFYDLLAPGGRIYFDDYANHDECRHAFSDFIHQQKQHMLLNMIYVGTQKRDAYFIKPK